MLQDLQSKTEALSVVGGGDKVCNGEGERGWNGKKDLSWTMSTGSLAPGMALCGVKGWKSG